MKRIFICFCLIAAFFACKKDNDEKKCYECITYSEKTFKDGIIKKDTGTIPICQTDVGIAKFIQSGTWDGESWSKESGKDTVFYYLKAKTECKLK